MAALVVVSAVEFVAGESFAPSRTLSGFVEVLVSFEFVFVVANYDLFVFDQSLVPSKIQFAQELVTLVQLEKKNEFIRKISIEIICTTLDTHLLGTTIQEWQLLVHTSQS